MNTPDRDPLQGWLAQARATLEADSEALDYPTRARLNQLRQRTLDAALPAARRPPWLGWAGLALAAGLGTLLALNLWQAPAGLVPAGAVAVEVMADLAPAELDAELLAASDSLELYENLEFYAWLQSQSVDG